MSTRQAIYKICLAVFVYILILKKSKDEGAVLIYEDEVSFRQDPTIYRTWARKGCQPLVLTTGQRNILKFFGSIEIYSARFLYHCQEVFNAQTYLVYLEKLIKSYFPRKIHFIQDNASYHKDSQVWTKCLYVHIL